LTELKRIAEEVDFLSLAAFSLGNEQDPVVAPLNSNNKENLVSVLLYFFLMVYGGGGYDFSKKCIFWG
jgi:hypothetical protein